MKMEKWLMILLMLCSIAYAEIIPEPEQTQDQKTAFAIRQLISHANGTEQNLRNNVQTGFDLFWHNPLATPAQIAAAMGNNACKPFVAMGKTVAFLTDLDAGYVAPVAPNHFTVNQNCTVEIGEPIESENP